MFFLNESTPQVWAFGPDPWRWLESTLVKLLFSRNFCHKSVRENFRNFHTMYCCWLQFHEFFFLSRLCVFKWSAFQKSSILVMPFIEFIICLGLDLCLGTFWWLPIISFMVNPWWIILLFWLTEQKFYHFLWDIIDLSHSACKLLQWTQIGQWILDPIWAVDTRLNLSSGY